MNLKVQMAVKNECYIIHRKINVKGVMIHSTGANNPNLRRYVGPDDGLLGKNPNNNDWNQFRPDGRQVCVHAFIGKLLDGSVASYQTLPWDIEGWHGGSGAKGRVNDTHIGFEICEDSLSDAAYFKSVYQEAVELTAYLCNLHKLNPLQDGVVICHAEGWQRGIATNHADVNYWFPKFGKTMDDFRNDVSKLTDSSDNTGELTMTQYNELKNLISSQSKEIAGLKSKNSKLRTDVNKITNMITDVISMTDSSRTKYVYIDDKNIEAGARTDLNKLVNAGFLRGFESEENGKKIIKYNLSDDLIRALRISGRMNGILD
jgi:N-acetylmuramoyl-L-alanine amidase CwlA